MKLRPTEARSKSAFNFFWFGVNISSPLPSLPLLLSPHDQPHPLSLADHETTFTGKAAGQADQYDIYIMRLCIL